ERAAIVNAMATIYNRGSRHELILAFAGMCATALWSEEATTQLVRDLCFAAADSQQADRLRIVSDTYLRLDAGEPIAGFSGLRDLYGDDPAKHIDTPVGAGASGHLVDAAHEAAPALQGQAFRAYRADELAVTEPPQLDYLVDTLIPRGQMVLLAGPPKG